MSGVLSPEQALAYLRELSPGVREALLLDAADRVLAGDASLAVLAGAGQRAGGAPVAPGETVVARSADATLMARLAPGALAAVARLDAETAVTAVRARC